MADQPHDSGSGSFSDLALRPELLTALDALGYEEPTPIQRQAIPELLARRDLLGQAATGTGKTAAFALPMLDNMEPGDSPWGLVLTPTRELAIQVSEAVHKYGRGLGARVVPIYGGQPIGRQLQALSRGTDIVVATPGRAVDHINRGSLDLDRIGMVVLDEADEMLDMGFADDLDAILSQLPEERQTVLFSATMPKRIESLARRHLTDPVTIRIAATEPEPGDVPRVRQVAYMVPRAHKAAALGRILDVESPTAAIVFCRTRHEVDALTETLNGRGYRAEALHGGLGQEARDRVMNRVRNGTSELLIATDVAARGLDIDTLTHVVNYDVPSAPETYVHRIGRVGRAGREGVAVTLAEPREHRLLGNITRVTRQPLPVEKLPTISDLQNRRMELTLSSLREVLTDGDDDDLDHYRTIVETLSDEFDLFDIALAAVRMAHDESMVEVDETEIPEVAPRAERRNDRPDRGDRSDRGDRRDRTDRGDRRERGERPKGRNQGGPSMTRLYFPIGRSSRIRPGDLVGAIAGETSLTGRDIGAIEITDKFSLVEVPDRAVDEVIDAIRSTTIKGRRVVPRRERFSR